MLEIDELAKLIAKRLESEIDNLADRYRQSFGEVGVHYVAIDDVLPTEIALNIHNKFPDVSKMRRMKSFREFKYTSKNFDNFDPTMRNITFAFQHPLVIAAVEKITGMKDQIPDSKLYAGGLSAMTRGHFLAPHIDNSHDSERQYYRTLNLLYYVTPDWELANGGNLELWDKKVKKNAVIESRFNRLVLMETNPWSWHSVNEVKVDGVRCCVSNYYFSQKAPAGGEYFHITAFSARPEQKFMRMFALVDGELRQALRKVVRGGLGKKDVYIDRGQ